MIFQRYAVWGEIDAGQKELDRRFTKTGARKTFLRLSIMNSHSKVRLFILDRKTGEEVASL